MSRITPSEALQRISSAQQQGMRLATSKVAKHPEFVMAVGMPEKDDGIYLFRNGKGSIVTPAIDELMPLLGESTNGDLSGELPPAYEEWLNMYAREIDFYTTSRLIEEDETSSELPFTAVPPQPNQNPQSQSDDEGSATAAPRKTISAICKATWGQTEPYNDLLIFDGERCPAGCWAVAVGIIMRHWGQLGFHRGCMPTTKYSYSGNPHTIEALPPITVFDYRNLTDGIPKTDIQKKAVGTMLKYIGAACKLRYAADGTSAWVSTATPFLKSRLRLGNNIKAVSDSSVTAAEFEEIIYNDIAAGRPVILRGANELGTGGHFFVVDGYNKTSKKYHINWGWKGNYNGNYALSALTPTKGYDYTFGKWVICGIKPDYILGDVNNDQRVDVTDVMVLLDKIRQGDTSIIGDINSDGKINADDWQLIIDTILGKKML